jgi:hypothetical protein
MIRIPHELKHIMGSDLRIVPRMPRSEPADQIDEAPGLIDKDQVDVERDQPLGGNESIERDVSEAPEPTSPDE